MMADKKVDDDCQQGIASSCLKDVASLAHAKGSLSIGEIITAMGPAGIAFTILILALPALTPIPGPFGLVFGTALAFVSLQISIGRTSVWLPKFLRNRRLSARVVELIVKHTMPMVARVERGVRAGRLRSLTGRSVQTMLGIPVFLMGVAIALPIPFGNFVPVIALVILAIGLLERDGLITLIGLGVTMIAISVTIFLIYSTASIITGIAT